MVSREADMAALKTEVAELKNSLQDLLKHAGEEVSEKTSESRKYVKSMMEQMQGKARDKVRNAYSATKDAGIKAIERGRGGISKSPYTVVLAAFMVGLGTGVLIKRK